MSGPLKAGTRIEVRVFDGAPVARFDAAKIGRRTKDTCTWDEMPGWHPVTFPDGARLTVHESRLRVVDNRA